MVLFDELTQHPLTDDRIEHLFHHAIWVVNRDLCELKEQVRFAADPLEISQERLFDLALGFGAGVCVLRVWSGDFAVGNRGGSAPTVEGEDSPPRAR